MQKINLHHYWYGIHPQFFFINLVLWKKIGCPLHLNYKSYNSKLYDAVRSKGNFHHDYTPFWLYPNGTTKKYSKNTSMSWGWNILNKTFEHGYKAISFTKSVRNLKKFYYLEELQKNKKDIIKIQKTIKNNEIRLTTNYSSKIYLFNSEPYPTEFGEQDFYSILNQIRAPEQFDNYIFLSSGFLGNYILDELGFTGSEKIIYYDISGPSLYFKHVLHTYWQPSGETLKDFIDQIVSHAGDRVGTDDIVHFADHLTSEYIDQAWIEEENHWGGKSLFINHWEKFRKNLYNVSYWHWDIVNNYQGWQIDQINKLPGKTFLWVSNVYQNEFILNAFKNYNNVAIQFKNLLNSSNPNIFVYGFLPDLKLIDTNNKKNIN